MSDRMRCQSAQRRMSVALVGEIDTRERLEAEAHAATCIRCASAIRDVAATAVALDRAYAPLRATTVALSAARVRLALRAPARPAPLVRYARLTAKLNELAVAAAVMAFAVLGSVPAPESRTPVDIDVVADPTLRLTAGYVEPVAVDRSFSLRLGRLLLHDNLLDARVVPVGDGSMTFIPKPALPGQPY